MSLLTAQEQKLLQNRFNSKIWDSFNYEQKKEIQKMCQRTMPKAFSRHVIAFRHSFWFFRHWYIVLLFGKDTRIQKREEGINPIKRFINSISLVFFYTILILGFIAFVLLCLYFFKCGLGIDILSDTHLQDLL